MKFNISEKKYNSIINNRIIVTNKIQKLKPGDKIKLETKTKMSIVEVDIVITPNENEPGLRLNFGIVKIKV